MYLSIIIFNTSPLPRRVSPRAWVLRLNAPNSYRAIVLSGVKGHKAQPPTKTVRKEDSWFVSQPGELLQRTLFIDDSPCKWYFNEKLYNYGNYIIDHSIQFDRDVVSDLYAVAHDVAAQHGGNVA
jgi:hypothetical protein